MLVQLKKRSFLENFYSIKVFMGSFLATLVLISCNEKESLESKIQSDIKVKVGTRKIVNLYLKNSSNNYIQINKLSTSCNCNILQNEKIILKPNKLDSIPIEIIASNIGVKKEVIILTHKNKYDKIELNYEVIK